MTPSSCHSFGTSGRIAIAAVAKRVVDQVLEDFQQPHPVSDHRRHVRLEADLDAAGERRYRVRAQGYADAAATLLDWVPFFPVTRDQLTMLAEGNEVDTDDVEVAGVRPGGGSPDPTATTVDHVVAGHRRLFEEE